MFSTITGTSSADTIVIAYDGGGLYSRVNSGSKTYYASPAAPFVIYAGAGNDQVYNFSDVQTTAYLGEGDDFYQGGSGIDTVTGEDGSDEIRGGDLGDYLYGDEATSLNPGNDKLFGEAGNDHLEGRNGSDTLFGGTGTDYVDGGNDYDTLDVGYFGSSTGSIISLDGGANDNETGTGAGSDNIQYIEIVMGTEGPDNISTTINFGFTFYGFGGNDTIQGAGGADTIYGGAGTDIVYGGGGNDTFYMFGDATQDTVYGGADYDTAYLDSGLDLYEIATVENPIPV